VKHNARSGKICQSIYLPEKMRAEVGAEMKRLDRSLPWLIQRAWIIARRRIMAIPPPPSDDSAAERPSSPPAGAPDFSTVAPGAPTTER
jgi:uncharacterized small protein (TIGR04563 family)